MKPVVFEGANVLFRPPEGMDNCTDLPVQKYKNEQDQDCCRSVWELSKEDVQYIAQHKIYICLDVVGGQPPVSIRLFSAEGVDNHDYIDCDSCNNGTHFGVVLYGQSPKCFHCGRIGPVTR